MWCDCLHIVLQSEDEAEPEAMDTTDDQPHFIAHVPVPSQKQVLQENLPEENISQSGHKSMA